jgi:hypothetical protein
MGTDQVLPEALEVTLQVAGVLERLDVTYFVGGSLASSLHGIPRATQDADLIAMLGRDHVEAFCGALEGDFYVDREMIHDAIARRASFNVIHLGTMFKVDVFVFRGDSLAAQEMARRERHELGGVPSRSLVFASAEDTVLEKLRWYRLGGAVSDRQWLDAVGVLRVRRGDLDREYLQRWAEHLQVGDLLAEAWREIEGDS